MRLGTCIALELAVATSAIGGAVVGVGYAIDRAGDYMTAREAAAASLAPTAPSASTVRRTGALATLAGGSYAPAREPPRPRSTTVFDAPDDELLAPLGATPLASVKLNHGGTSLSLRLEFQSGARAAFKPQQVHPQSDPRKEIAAYRLDRLLGIGHVPPAKAGAFALDELIAAVEPAARAIAARRFASEAIAPGGIVRGELSWWIPEIRDLKLDGVLADDAAGMNRWTAWLQVGATIPPAHRAIATQLATCVVFDVLIDNADRWTGYNTKSSVDQTTLYFMDNTLSFSTFTWGHATNLGPLQRIQVFPRALIDRVRGLTVESVTAAVGDGGALAPLLRPDEIAALLARRDHVIRYVDDLIAQFGERRVLAL